MQALSHLPSNLRTPTSTGSRTDTLGAAADTASGVTHIVMPYGDQMAMLLPMLAYLSQQSPQKWFTCIAPSKCNVSGFKLHGIDSKHLRVVRDDYTDDRLWLAWDALANGNSATVLVFVESLSVSDKKRLEDAASLGKTRAVIIESPSIGENV